MKTTLLVKEIRPYSMKELCRIYGVSDKTMRKWLRPFASQIGERQGHIYNVSQITVIFQNLGVPGVME